MLCTAKISIKTQSGPFWYPKYHFLALLGPGPHNRRIGLSWSQIGSGRVSSHLQRALLPYPPPASLMVDPPMPVGEPILPSPKEEGGIYARLEASLEHAAAPSALGGRHSAGSSTYTRDALA